MVDERVGEGIRVSIRRISCTLTEMSDNQAIRGVGLHTCDAALDLPFAHPFYKLLLAESRA